MFILGVRCSGACSPVQPGVLMHTLWDIAAPLLADTLRRNDVRSPKIQNDRIK